MMSNRSNRFFTETAGQVPWLISLALAVMGAMALGEVSCSGSRFFINLPGNQRRTGNTSVVADSSDYWVLYQDWHTSHRNLLRMVENPRIPRSSLEQSFGEAAASLRMLEEHIPPEGLEEFNNALEGYESIHKNALAGTNRSIVRERLYFLGKSIRRNFNPDAIASRQSSTP